MSFVRSTTQVLAVAISILGVACGGSDAQQSEDNVTAGGQPLPPMGGNNAWLECNDGTMSVNVFDYRGEEAVNVTDLKLFIGKAMASGRIDDANDGVQLTGDSFRFDGTAKVDFPNNVLSLKGNLLRSGESKPADVDRKLSCNRLGLDYPAHGPAIAPVQGHGDSAWLICDSASIVANILEYRGADGASRVTDITLVADGHSIVSGTLNEESSSLVAQGSGDSFRGTASVTYAGAKNVKLKGAYVFGGTSYTVDQTISCQQLFADL